MALPDVLSDEEMNALESGSGGGGGGYGSHLPDVLSEDEMTRLEMSAPKSSWNLFDAAKQFGAGVVEGDVGLVGLAGDLNPFVDHPYSTRKPGLLSSWLGLDQGIGWGPDLTFGYSHKLKEGTDAILPEADPQYRYSRTGGQFLGPGLTGAPFRAAGIGVKTADSAANSALELLTSQATPVALASAASGSVGAQGAQDMFKDSAIAPLLGALALGSLPSMASGIVGAAKSAFTPATAAEVEGSAAKAFQDFTKLSPQEIEQSIAAAPKDQLGRLMTTAEVTGNAGAAQLERSLSASGQAGIADIYNAVGKERSSLRDKLLGSMTTTEAVNKEGLGSSLIEKAGSVKQQLTEAEQALWAKLPRDIPVITSGEKRTLSSVASSQAGFGDALPGRTRNLVDQFLGTGKTEGRQVTTGNLQTIRSDALRFLRDKEVTPFETRVLNSLRENIDSAMEKTLTSSSNGSSTAVEDWLAARNATATKAEMFKQGTAGGTFTNDASRPSNVLQNAFKGDRQSVEEIKAAIHRDPQLLEDVKRGLLDKIGRNVAGDITPNEMKKFVSGNEGGLKALFGEDQYAQMRRIVEDLQSEANVKGLSSRASKGGSDTAQNATVAGAINDMAIGSLLPKTGQLGKLAVAIQGIFGASNVEKVKETLFKAAMEPDLALLLSQAPTNTRIFNAGERLMSILGDTARSGATAAALEASRTQEASPEQKIHRAPVLDPSSQPYHSGGQSSPPGPLSHRADQRSGDGGVFDFLTPQTANATEVGPQDQLGQVLGIPSPNSAPSSHVNQVFDALSNAVKHVESRGNANAESPKGAIGTHQVTPIAARDVLRAQGVDDRQYSDSELKTMLRQPGMSQQFGEAYLQLLIQRYDGNVELALAAYNGGPSRLEEVGRDISKMPAETRNYVPAVFAALTRGQA